MGQQRHLQPALYRALITLNNLPNGSVILDRFGHAWQLSRNYWYRAYGDDEETNSWTVAQCGPVKVIHETK